MSATHSWFGPLAWKRRLTRSGRRLALVATGGHGEASALADALDAGRSHETRHTLAADAHALLDELEAHPGHAVGLVGVLVNLADALGHHRIGDAAL
jgi:hypothetical protein